jgi:hypothetical protein
MTRLNIIELDPEGITTGDMFPKLLISAMNRFGCPEP